jgi:hypothetical protein
MKTSFKPLMAHQVSFQSFMEEFIAETDRAAVILGAAKVEFQLGQLLETYFLPCTGSADDLLEGDSPLATFSAKIRVCHRLGLIDDTFVKLLNTFRRLRNGFAHEVTANSLAAGSARDRVFSMAEPFKDSRFFLSLLNKIARNMEKEVSEPSVVFRAVLAIFLLNLNRLHRSICVVKPLSATGVASFCADSVPPDDEESSDSSSDD